MHSKSERKGPAEDFAGFIILSASFKTAFRESCHLLLKGVTVTGLAVILACVCVQLDSRAASAAPQTTPADAAPKISQVQPSKAQPGSQVTVKIKGERFDSGAYVTFSDPAIRVLATRRLSETQLEVDIAVGEMAKPQSVILYVSNSSGASAQTPFAITSGTAASTKASPPASANAPIVTKVDPAKVEPGSKYNIKVTGKNFKDGAKVAFSNPGIRVLGTDFKKSTELVAQVEVAPNAPTGKSSLFVINPDDSEVEATFEVEGGSPAKSGTTASTTNAQTQQFSVYNLGDATSIFQNPGKAKGELVVAGGQLKYEQDGKVLFTAKPADIQEIAPNVFFGLNTGTFHIILNSGKSYNFVSTSLAPADTNSIMESLRQALK